MTKKEQNEIAAAIYELAEQVGNVAAALGSGYTNESIAEKIGEHTYWMFKEKMENPKKK
jgi:hypothetical protein